MNNEIPTLEQLTEILNNAFKEANPGWTEEQFQKFKDQIQEWYLKKYE